MIVLLGIIGVLSLVSAILLFFMHSNQGEEYLKKMRKLCEIHTQVNRLERYTHEEFNEMRKKLEGLTKTHSENGLCAFVSDLIKEQEKINEEMNKREQYGPTCSEMFETAKLHREKQNIAKAEIFGDVLLYPADAGERLEVVRNKDYEFRDENGNVIEAKKIVLEKKKPKYPKSYSECLEILGYHSTNLLLIGEPKDFAKVSHEEKKFTFLTLQFWKLLVCRDAYWKIAGDWKLSIGIPFYYLYYNRQLENIKKDYADDIQGNVILAFPTKEMRDAFYENFKELINECKELL